MSDADELLIRCRVLGVSLAAGKDGALLWEADEDPSAELLGDLAKNKSELLALLLERDGSAPMPPAAGFVWVTLESGRVEECHASAIPPDAILWCRSGDKAWTRLPRPRPEGERVVTRQ